MEALPAVGRRHQDSWRWDRHPKDQRGDRWRRRRSDRVLRLAPATDTFTAGTSSPNNRQEGGAFSIGQEMFVAAATSRRPAPTLPSWTATATTPGARSDDGRLLRRAVRRIRSWRRILHGWPESRLDDGIQRQDGVGVGEDQHGPSSLPRRVGLGEGLGYASEKVYLIAGDPVQSPSMAYTPILDCYEVLPTYVGTNRRFQASFGLMGKVYSCGGIDDTVGTHDLVDVLGVATLTWSAGPVASMGQGVPGRIPGESARVLRRRNDSAGSRQQHAASLRSGAWVSLSALGANKVPDRLCEWGDAMSGIGEHFGWQ